MGDDRLECGQPFDFECLSLRIERDDLVELTQRNAPFGTAPWLVPKQVRNRRLG